ncbi:MAG: sulfate adenylyltransferase subunit CysN [Bryobacteraceae bacterium]
MNVGGPLPGEPDAASTQGTPAPAAGAKEPSVVIGGRPRGVARAAAFASFLRHDEEKELLRFSTAGSVDDGKSTLIGRLLFDSKGVYEDQVASVLKARSSQTDGTMDFALLTDGLRAEREQGITIDVAYRYFATPRRKFIIADTPGHEQYTRNMATGASTANLAIVLVDARHGVLAQTRRHAFIASLLGTPHIVVAVNKMDLVDWRQRVFEAIEDEFTRFAAQLPACDLHFIPISALLGDNVVEKSPHMPWFQGESLLHHLETVHIASDRNLMEMRFPVQHVIRPDQNFRGYAGQVASGTLTPGDPVMVLPSGRTSRIKSISTFDGDLPKAFAPLSVTVCLEDELDISRGDMLVHPSHAPQVARTIDARLVWMSQTPLDQRREYIVKHTTQEVAARVRTIRYRVDVNTLERHQAGELCLNDIGAAVIETRKPLFVDPYRRNRATGAFILIDPLSNETVAAGMITGRPAHESGQRPMMAAGRVTPAERHARTGHTAAAIWVTQGAEAAGALERALFDGGAMVLVLEAAREGDLLPHLVETALAAGLIVLCAADSPAPPAQLREIAGPDRFLEFSGGAGECAGLLLEMSQRGILRRE